MGTLASLFSQIGGVFGKPYLLTGLLPAAALTWAWSWYRGGGGAVRTAVSALFVEKPAAAAGAALGTLVTLLAMGLLFYASRELVLEFMRALPGSRLSWLRRRLLERQMLARKDLERDQRLALDQYTALRWHRHGFGKASYVASGAPHGGAAAAMAGSKAARATVEAVVQRAGSGDVSPTRADAETIIGGLSALHAASGRGEWSPECDKELAAWRAALAEPRWSSVLEVVGRDVLREYFAFNARLRAFPQPIWMQPTRLGNRAAALDDYGERNYGLDTSSMWSRLSGLVPADERTAVNNALLTVEALLNLSAASLVLVVGVAVTEAVTALLLLMRHGIQPPDFRWLAFVAVGLVAAYLTYRAAVYAFGGVAERIISLVDLYRLKLLRQFGFAIPATVADELALFRQLRGFFAQGAALDRTLKLQQT